MTLETDEEVVGGYEAVRTELCQLFVREKDNGWQWFVDWGTRQSNIPGWGHASCMRGFPDKVTAIKDGERWLKENGWRKRK